jgi:chromosome segregation ATPase
MGYWKGRHITLEQEVQEANGRVRLLFDRNAKLDAQNAELDRCLRLERTISDENSKRADNLHLDRISLAQSLNEVSKTSEARTGIIKILEGQALMLRATSQQLTSSCANLRTENNSLRQQLNAEMSRLTPVLPPLPLPLVCRQAHTNLAEIERTQALRKENDEQRKIIADLRRSHEITTQEVGVGRSVIGDLRRDNEQLAFRVRELSGNVSDLMRDPHRDAQQVNRLQMRLEELQQSHNSLHALYATKMNEREHAMTEAVNTLNAVRFTRTETGPQGTSGLKSNLGA